MSAAVETARSARLAGLQLAADPVVDERAGRVTVDVMPGAIDTWAAWGHAVMSWRIATDRSGRRLQLDGIDTSAPGVTRLTYAMPSA